MSAPPERPALDGRSRTTRRRALAVLAVAAGLAVAWLVLVTLRLRVLGTAPPPGDDLAARAQEAVAGTMLADRVQSVLQWVANVGTTFLLGGIIFRTFVAGPHLPADPDRTAPPAGSHTWDDPDTPVRRAVHRAGLVALVCSPATVVARAAAVAGGPDALDLAAVRFVAETRFGDATLLRVAGVAILLGLALPDDPRRPSWIVHAASATGGAVVLASFAVGGHLRVTDPAHLLVLVQGVHIVAVSTWFGGVACLAIELRRIRREATPVAAATVVARFSRVAMVTVILAGGTGMMLAASQMTSPSALVSTPYGRALTAKLVLLTLPLALGAYNDRVLVPAVTRRGEARAWTWLQRTAAVESGLLALGVLLMTAAMTSGGI